MPSFQTSSRFFGGELRKDIIRGKIIDNEHERTIHTLASESRYSPSSFILGFTACEFSSSIQAADLEQVNNGKGNSA